MKTIHTTTKVAGAILALTFAAGTLASAQSTNAPTPAKKEAAPAGKGQSAPTQIVFVPKKMMDENKTAGKLKENTFYWSNVPDDATQGPKVSEEAGVPYLLLKGCGDEKAQKPLTEVTLVRAYNIPEGTTSVTITAELKQSYDEWVDQNSAATALPSFTYSFFKNGIEARKLSRINLPGRNLKQWKTVTTRATVPTGAQQLVIVGKADFPTSVSIASLDVSFDNKPGAQ